MERGLCALADLINPEVLPLVAPKPKKGEAPVAEQPKEIVELLKMLLNKPGDKTLGQALQKHGGISQDELKAAKAEAQAAKKPLAEILVSTGRMTAAAVDAAEVKAGKGAQPQLKKRWSGYGNWSFTTPLVLLSMLSSSVASAPNTCVASRACIRSACRGVKIVT